MASFKIGDRVQRKHGKVFFNGELHEWAYVTKVGGWGHRGQVKTCCDPAFPISSTKWFPEYDLELMEEK